MSASYQRAKAVHADAREKASRIAVGVVRDLTGEAFTVSEWTRSARQAYAEQWESHSRHADGDFQWPEIFEKYRGPDVLTLAIWQGDRLCGLAMATVSASAVRIEYMERDPRPDCPLAGKMIPLVLEMCANYAQLRGRTELRLVSVRSSLKGLYVETYGFQEVAPRGELPYLKRDV